MKKTVSLLLSLIMILSVIMIAPVSAFAQVTLDSNKVYVKTDGEYYEVQKGQTYTYTYCVLVKDTKVTGIDATTYYDSDGLKFIPDVDEYGDNDLSVMYPTLLTVIYNYNIDGELYHTYSNSDGVRFTKENTPVFVGKFLVTADSGVYEINTTITSMCNSDLENIVFNGEKLKDYEDSQVMPELTPETEATQPPTQAPTPAPTVAVTQTPTEEPTLSPNEVHVVAGESGLCGSTWDPADKNNQMTYNAQSGNYEIVYKNVSAGTYKFKVTTDYEWGKPEYNLDGIANNGGADATVTVDEDGSTVIISFDGEKALVEVMAPATEPPTVAPTPAPTDAPTEKPTAEPTEAPTVEPTEEPTDPPTEKPTEPVTETLTAEPTDSTATDPSEPFVSVTVYCINSANWSQMWAYAWTGSDQVATWPGVVMDETDMVAPNGAKVYSITFAKEYENIIFSDSDIQTDNLVLYADKYYDNVENQWYDSIDQVPTQAPSTEPTDPPTEKPTQAPTIEPTEEPTQAPTKPATEAETQEPTQPSTAAPTDAPTQAVDGIYIKADGELIEVEQGQEFLYVYNLAYSKKISGIDASTYYDTAGLEFIPVLNSYGDYDLPAMFPRLLAPTYNFSIGGEIVYNYSIADGVRFPQNSDGEFTDDNRVAVFKFKVTGGNGIYEINTVIRALGDVDNKPLIYDCVLQDGVVIDTGAEIIAPEDPTEPPTEPETEPPTEPVLVGDADNDGKVSIFDVTEIQLYLAKYIEFDERDSIAADADRNGKINIFDATQIQLYLAKYIESL